MLVVKCSDCFVISIFLSVSSHLVCYLSQEWILLASLFCLCNSPAPSPTLTPLSLAVLPPPGFRGFMKFA